MKLIISATRCLFSGPHWHRRSWLFLSSISAWMIFPGGVASQSAADLTVPEVFSPGNISSGAHDSAPAFSPDGRTVYFGRSTPVASTILVAHRVDKGWSRPTIAPFSGEWLDMEPAMSPDDTYLIFVSNRPSKAGGQPIDGAANNQLQPGKGGNLWRVDRRGREWSRPVRLPDLINNGGSIYAPSISRDGTLYFMKPATTTGRFQLFSAKKIATGYAASRALPFSDGSTTDVDPAIAPDQSYLIFGSSRHANTNIDLFVTHRTAAGWLPPRYLGEPINGLTSDAEPRLSPDGRTLYYSSERFAPVNSPIARRTSARVVNDMSAWNNGLYDIWRVDLESSLLTRSTSIPQTGPVAMETRDEAGIRATEQRWSQAFVAGDEAALRTLLDENYVSVSAEASLQTKAQVIAAAKRHAAKYPRSKASPLADTIGIKIIGDAAIVRHTGIGERSVDVLQFAAGRWVALYSQHSGGVPSGAAVSTNGVNEIN